jgi:CheY-like chemotaxis protein
MPLPDAQNFRGRRVLIVEDEQLIAWDLSEELRAAGAFVMEPKGTVDAALHALAHEAAPDVAVLDLHLTNGEPAFAIADQLRSRRIPFVFYSGLPHDCSSDFQRYQGVAYCAKPMECVALAAALETAMRSRHDADA